MYKVSRRQIDKGDFPLNHDCILKVVYIKDSPICFEYFTCRSQDSGLIAESLASLSIVNYVNFTTLDELSCNFYV